MFIEVRPVGPLACNCTLLACDSTREGVIVDPGGDGEDLVSRIKELDIKLQAVVHTHAHFDHIGGTACLCQACNAKAALHEEDRYLYDDVESQVSNWGFSPFEVPELTWHLQDGEDIPFGKHKLTVLHTPGHTPGSVCFKVDGEALLLSGDTLFQGSVGRTDFPGGNQEQLFESIRSRLYTLPEDTVVVPGHGPQTQVGHELQHNPFVRS